MTKQEAGAKRAVPFSRVWQSVFPNSRMLWVFCQNMSGVCAGAGFRSGFRQGSGRLGGGSGEVPLQVPGCSGSFTGSYVGRRRLGIITRAQACLSRSGLSARASYCPGISLSKSAKTLLPFDGSLLSSP